MMKRFVTSTTLSTCFLAAVFAVGAAALAPTAVAQVAATAKIAGPTAGAVGGAVAVTATVESVNHDTREVTLKSESGELLEIVAGDEVRNLDQVQVGDIVEVEYFEALALALQDARTGIQERVESTDATRAPLGDKPSGTVTHRVESIGKVVAVDKENRLVVLQGPEHTLTVKAGDDVDLDSLQEGDEVKAVYIKEVAISVRSPE